MMSCCACKRVKTVDEENRLKLDTDELYLKSAEEMVRGFDWCPGAVERTLEVADRCNLEIEFGKYHFPTFTPPKEISLDDYLDELSYAGLNERLEGVTDPAVRKSYLERLEYELGVIKDMQFPGYFLVVADFINYAKRNGIPVGPGRGSSPAVWWHTHCASPTSIRSVMFCCSNAS
jgi:DNA polymerase-3 subunit alpha